MASLLDAYIARNPQLGGLLGGGGGPQGPAPAAGIPAPQVQAQAQAPQGVPPAPQGPQGAPGGPQGGPEQMAAMQQQAAQQQQMKLQEVFQAAGRAVAPMKGQEQSRIDTRETLLYAGLSLLGGGGQTTFAQAIATGVLAGRQAAVANEAAKRQEIALQERAQRYMNVFGDEPLTRSRVDQAIQVATISGDTDTLKVLKDIQGQMPSDAEMAERTSLEGPDGKLYFTDKQGNLFLPDGEQVFEQPKYTPPDDKQLTTMDDGSGKPIKVLVNMADGTFEKVGDDYVNPRNPYEGAFTKDIMVDGEVHTLYYNQAGQVIRDLGSAKAGGTQGSQSALMKANALAAELEGLKSIIGDDYSGLPRIYSDKVPRWAQSEKTQRFHDGAGAIGSMVLNLRSGATATEQEFGRIMQANLPAPGDKAKTIEAKYKRIERIITEFHAGGLEAVRQYGAVDEDEPPPALPEGALGNTVDMINQLGG